MGISYAQIEQSGYTYYSSASFIEQLRLCGMVRYWQARCAWDGAAYEPSAVLLNDENALFYAMNHDGSATDTFRVNFGSAPASEQDAPEQYGGLAVYAEDAAAAIDRFNQQVRLLAQSYDGDWSSLQCTVVENESGAVYAPGADLSGFLQRDASLLDAWEYLVAVRYSASGDVLSAYSWADPTAGADASGWVEDGADWKALVTSYLDETILEYYDFAPLHDVTLVFAVPQDLDPYDALAGYGHSNRLRRFYNAFIFACWAAFAACALLALWFGRRRGSGLGGKRLAALPMELYAAALLCVAAFLEEGTPADALFAVFDDSIPLAIELVLLIALGATFALLAALFLPILAVRQGFVRYGWKTYLARHTLVGQMLRALRAAWRIVGRQIVRLWKALTRVDLRDSTDRTLARLLAVNFLIVTAICCFWVFGVIGTLLYSVVLFFLLRGRLAREQQHYAALLDSTRRMAEGDLTTPITGDLGMFDPLRDELNQVRVGFEKAVAAEVRSQNMKTELISNVSHDLKTPLTAIITYVDLLKDPDLSAEERAKYIDTLDRKSQRLKHLIEDLFEVSKAATGNVAMHYTEVDLAALLKQVQYELADKLQSCGIDFRWQLPEGRVPLVLDGPKTCRILENLLVNITKYGMPGTRAYITLTPLENGAQIELKNVSATELDFDAQHITERFVRGDRSRNSEGSGLGLAIVKSFAELQGGTFEVATDGDLFKAIVTLPGGHAPEQTPEAETPEPPTPRQETPPQETPRLAGPEKA